MYLLLRTVNKSHYIINIVITNKSVIYNYVIRAVSAHQIQKNLGRVSKITVSN